MADDSLSDDLQSLCTEIQERNNADYDGINGTPPSWLPKFYRDKFNAARARVMGSSYSPKPNKVLQWMDAIDSLHGNLDSATYRPSYFPADLKEELSFLCEVRHMVWLGENDALQRLIGYPLSALGPARVQVDDLGRVLLVDKHNQLKANDQDEVRAICERHLAGRYTLEEVSLDLASKSGIEEKRWLETITNAVKAGELPLRNPRNLEDNLPYAVPETLRYFHDQLQATDVNAWLKAHPDFGPYRMEENAPSGIKTVRQTTKRTRVDRLTKAIIEGHRRKPGLTSNGLFDWLGRNDDTGAILEYSDEELTWQDWKGKLHDINRRVFANRVSSLRKKGLLDT